MMHKNFISYKDLEVSFTISSSTDQPIIAQAFADQSGKNRFKDKYSDYQRTLLVSNSSEQFSYKIPLKTDLSNLQLHIYLPNLTSVESFPTELTIEDLIIGKRKIKLNDPSNLILNKFITYKADLNRNNGAIFKVKNEANLYFKDLNQAIIEDDAFKGDHIFSYLEYNLDLTPLSKFWYGVSGYIQLNYLRIIKLLILYEVLILFPYRWFSIRMILALRLLKRLSLTVPLIITILFALALACYMVVLWNEAFNVYRWDYFKAFNKIFKSNFWELLTLIILVAVNRLLPRWSYKIPLFVCSLLFLSLIVTDLFTVKTFNTRFVINDALNFGGDIFKSLDIIENFIRKNPILSLMILSTYGVMGYVTFIPKGKSEFRNSAILLTLALVVNGVLPAGEMTLWENYFNGLYANYHSTHRLPYTADYKFQDRDHAKELLEIKGRGLHKNVIVLMVESLSANESKFFHGVNDHTPKLDKIAKSYTSFTNYYSNGYNTDTGNFSFCSGIPFIRGEMNTENPKEQKYFQHSIVNNFVEQGYNTKVVFSASNVGGLGAIWHNCGFQEYFGGDQPFYNESERLSFNSVPDRDLFDFFISKLDSWQNEEKPFFSLIMTTTTHQPYLVPGTEPRERNFTKTIRYIDLAIDDFLAKLKEHNFFENGILVITGDHRAMVPYSNDEKQIFKMKGIARVPAVIVGKGFESKVNQDNFSHILLSNYLAYLMLDSYKIYDQNLIYLPIHIDASIKDHAPNLVKEQPIFYQFHNPEDLLLVIYKGEEYRIKLNGDETDFIDQPPSESFREQVLKTVYWLRTRS